MTVRVEMMDSSIADNGGAVVLEAKLLAKILFSLEVEVGALPLPVFEVERGWVALEDELIPLVVEEGVMESVKLASRVDRSSVVALDIRGRADMPVFVLVVSKGR